VQNLKRKINIGFRVTEEEQDAIKKRMELAGINSLRIYMLKMALTGYIINLDLTDVRECSRLLRSVSNNVNQLARHANAGGTVSAVELAKVREELGAVWEQQNKTIKNLTKVLEAA